MYLSCSNKDIATCAESAEDEAARERTLRSPIRSAAVARHRCALPEARALRPDRESIVADRLPTQRRSCTVGSTHDQADNAGRDCEMASADAQSRAVAGRDRWCRATRLGRASAAPPEAHVSCTEITARPADERDFGQRLPDMLGGRCCRRRASGRAQMRALTRQSRRKGSHAERTAANGRGPARLGATGPTARRRCLQRRAVDGLHDKAARNAPKTNINVIRRASRDRAKIQSASGRRRCQRG